ncbi:MAG: poly-beta-hydroxybutyrate polymerase N-terminal domain-containing protein, partial [bacterium]
LKNAHIEDPVDSGSGDDQNQVTAYVNSQLSELTGGLSPLMLFMAYQDWIMHLASNPNKQKVLFEKWLDSASRLSAYNLKSMDFRFRYH